LVGIRINWIPIDLALHQRTKITVLDTRTVNKAKQTLKTPYENPGWLTIDYTVWISLQPRSNNSITYSVLYCFRLC